RKRCASGRGRAGALARLPGAAGECGLRAVALAICARPAEKMKAAAIAQAATASNCRRTMRC
ncbi:MAG: hypothetical protein WA660_05675, partial [Candidatus Acidiferrales bacterium]